MMKMCLNDTTWAEHTYTFCRYVPISITIRMLKILNSLCMCGLQRKIRSYTAKRLNKWKKGSYGIWKLKFWCGCVYFGILFLVENGSDCLMAEEDLRFEFGEQALFKGTTSFKFIHMFLRGFISWNWKRLFAMLLLFLQLELLKCIWNKSINFRVLEYTSIVLTSGSL